MKSEEDKISETKLNALIFLIQKKLHQQAYQSLYSYLNHWMNNIVWRNKQKFLYIPLNLNDMQYYKNISFWKSIMQFDGTKNIPFPQFAIQRLNWFLLTKMRMYSSQKFKHFNFSRIYNDNWLLKTQSRKYVTAEISELPDFTYCMNALSHLEQNIFKLRMQEYKNQEISQELFISTKKVDNAWQRIKKKLKLCIIL